LLITRFGPRLLLVAVGYCPDVPINTGALARVSTPQARKLGVLLHALAPAAESFVDGRYFPPSDDATEQVARFFFFVTSIDHRTSPPGQSFEGLVEGQYFQGSDLLWHLSLRKYQADSDFFDPARMATLTEADLREWLTVQTPVQVTIRNPGERAALLRDCGQRLLETYKGSVLNLLKRTSHRLTRTVDKAHPGLLSLLAKFKAYEDPATKKTFLLLKFLLRRGLWTVSDIDQVRIPVDNHLSRIAFRTGIVDVSPGLANKLRQAIPIEVATDIALRRVVADAYARVAQQAQRSVLELDDFLWHFGRQCCTADLPPVCVRGCSAACYAATALLPSRCRSECPLHQSCMAYNDVSRRQLREAKLETWYY
jgi:hypothetical protein